MGLEIPNHLPLPEIKIKKGIQNKKAKNFTIEKCNNGNFTPFGYNRSMGNSF